MWRLLFPVRPGIYPFAAALAADDAGRKNDRHPGSDRRPEAVARRALVFKRASSAGLMKLPFSRKAFVQFIDMFDVIFNSPSRSGNLAVTT
jgi:hypothetical protein